MLKILLNSHPILSNVKLCANPWSRGLGLMFRRHIAEDEALLFAFPRAGRAETAITMLFVFFPISVFWLDEHGVVIDRTLARPFHLMYVPEQPARYILEGHPSLLEQIQVGDHISWEVTP